MNKRVAQNKATTAENNAIGATRAGEINELEARRCGENEALAVRRSEQDLKTTQRAVLAGHGLDISFGTAADIQDQTDFFAPFDAATR